MKRSYQCCDCYTVEKKDASSFPSRHGVNSQAYFIPFRLMFPSPECQRSAQAASQGAINVLGNCLCQKKQNKNNFGFLKL